MPPDSKGLWETHLLFAPLLIASRYPVSHGQTYFLLDGPLILPDGPSILPEGPSISPDGPPISPDGPLIPLDPSSGGCVASSATAAGSCSAPQLGQKLADASGSSEPQFEQNTTPSSGSSEPQFGQKLAAASGSCDSQLGQKRFSSARSSVILASLPLASLLITRPQYNTKATLPGNLGLPLQTTPTSCLLRRHGHASDRHADYRSGITSGMR